MAHLLIIGLMRLQFAVLQDTHDNGTASVGTGVLGQVVRARELLAAFVALEWLVLRVERAVVTLEVLLATEAASTEGADEGLGGILGQGLLSTSTVGRGVL